MPLHSNRNKIFVLSGSLFAVMAGSAFALSHTSFAQQPSPTPTETPTPTPTETPSPTPPATVPSDRILMQSNLTPVNFLSSVSGNATFVIDGEQLGIFMNLNGLAPDMSHLQFIFNGTTCPNFSSDTNSDGYVDVTEIMSTAGSPILPLTVNLSQTSNEVTMNPMSMLNQYPVADTNGNTTYITSVPISTIQTIMHNQTMASPTPEVTILPEGSPSPSISPEATPSASLMNPMATAHQEVANFLQGRVLMIHGVEPSISLPSTVHSAQDLPASETLPVGCGTIEAIQ